MLPNLFSQVKVEGVIVTQNSVLSASHELIARENIQLLPGFSIDGVGTGRTLVANINKNGQYPMIKDPNQTDLNRPINLNYPVGSTNGMFNVSAIGCANYSIPINVPAGLNNLQPNLAISYNSQAGNGLLGMGWNLNGLSAITMGQIPNYDAEFDSHEDLRDFYKYYLDGELMYVLNQGNYHSVQSKYKTKYNPNSFIVSRNRSGSNDDFIDYFEVYDQNGSKAIYGNDGNNVNSDILYNNEYLIAAYLTKVEDANGNYIKYIYKKHEGDIYIDYIEYTGTNSASPFARIDFVYEKRPDNLKTGYIGTLNDNELILGSVIIKNRGTIVKEYVFKYHYINLYAYLKEVIEFDGDGNRYNALSLQYDETLTYTNSSEYVTMDLINFNDIPHTIFSAAGDINGDGKDDLLANYEREAFVENKWKLFLDVDDPGTYTLLPGLDDYKYSYIADFNGDGENEILFIKGSETAKKVIYYQGQAYISVTNIAKNDLLKFYKWNGSALVNYDNLSLTASSMTSKNMTFYLGDYDDDKITDIFLYDATGYGWIFLGEKNGFQNSQPDFSVNNLPTNALPISGDFNGDGKSDILMVSSGGAARYNAIGNTITSDGDIFQSTLITNANILHALDFNGDGLTDIVKINNTKSHSVFISDGVSLFKIPDLDFNASDLSGIDEGANRPTYTEANGDGKSDLFRFANSTRYVLRDISDGKAHIGYSRMDLDQYDIFRPNFIDALTIGDYNADGISDAFVSFSFQIKKSDARYGQILTYATGFAEKIQELENLLGRAIGTDELITARIGVFRNESPQGNLPMVLTGIIDGINNVTRIDYTKTYERVKETFPVNESNMMSIKSNLQMVGSVTTADAIGGSSRLEYTYYSPRFERTGYGFLGFKYVDVTDYTNAIYTRKEYGYSIYNNPTQFVFHPYLKSVSELNDIFNIPVEVYSEDHEYGFGFSDNISVHRFVPYVKKSTKTDHRKNHIIIEEADNYFLDDRNLFDFDDYFFVPKLKQTTYKNIQGTTKNAIDKYEIAQTDYTFEFVESNQYRFLIKTLKATSSFYFSDNVNLSLSSTTSHVYRTDRKWQLDYTKIDENTAEEVKKTYTYYPNGLVETMVAQAKNYSSQVESRGERFVYDPSYSQFLIEKSSTQDVNFKTRYNYDEIYGTIRSEVDLNSLTTLYEYDRFYQLKKSIYPDGTFSNYSTEWVVAGDTDAPIGAHTLQKETHSDGSFQKTYFNKAGLKLRIVTNGFSGIVFSDFEYNHLGQVLKQSEPYYKNVGSPVWTVYNYLPDRRLQSLDIPGNGDITYTYNVNAVTSTQHGITRQTKTDSEGFVYESKHNGQTITFSKTIENRNGKPAMKTTSISPDGSRVIAYSDNNGRKIELIDPDAGTIKYEYTGFDEIKKQIKPDGSELRYEYADLGRPTTVSWYTHPNGSTNFIEKFKVVTDFDAPNARGSVEKLTSYSDGSTTPINSVEYTYDTKARPSKVKETIETRVFEKTFTYNTLGQIHTETYHNGFGIENIYTGGYLSQIKNKSNNAMIWQANNVDAKDRLVEKKYGDNTTTTWQYTNNLPNQVKVLRNGANLFKSDYTWDDTRRQLTDMQFYYASGSNWNMQRNYHHTFDSYNRLESSIVNGNLLFDIDYNNQNGSITYNKQIGNYSYSDIFPEHAIKSVDDVNGILSQERDLTYTAFDKINSITYLDGSKLLEIDYGVDFERVKTEYTENPTRKWTRYYALGNCELIINENNVEELHIYLSAPGGLFLIVKNGTEMHYMHTDYLGTIYAETNDINTTYTIYSYDAWGRRTNSSNGTYAGAPTNIWFTRGYTGHEHLDEMGLINMNGRMYDPILCSFLSPDNNIQDPFNPDNYNRYAYCLNNPLIYSDPSGEFWQIVIGAAIGGTVNWLHNGARFDAKGLGYFAVGAATGALSALTGGAIAGATKALGLIPGALIGGASGALIGGASQGLLNGLNASISGKESFSTGFTQGFNSGYQSGAISGATYGAINGYKQAKMIEEYYGDNIRINKITGRAFIHVSDFHAKVRYAPVSTGVSGDKYCYRATAKYLNSSEYPNDIVVIDGEEGGDPTQLLKCNWKSERFFNNSREYRNYPKISDNLCTIGDYINGSAGVAANSNQHWTVITDMSVGHKISIFGNQIRDLSIISTTVMDPAAGAFRNGPTNFVNINYYFK